MNEMRLGTSDKLQDKQNASLGNQISFAAAMLLVFSMLGISIFKYGTSAVGLLIFFAFFIVYILLPGLFLIGVSPLKVVHLSTRLTLGLFTGWSLNILLYFISEAIGNNILLYAVCPLLSLLFTFNAQRAGRIISPKSIGRIISHIPATAYVFFMLVFLYASLTTQFFYKNPAINDFTFINPDKAYHIGLIGSLSHGYPLESLWIHGKIINYHIFTEMLYSIPVRLFGLTPDFLMLSCGPFMTTAALCLSLYSFFKEMSARPERAGLYSLFVVLASPFLSRSFYDSIAFIFVITNDNATGFGVASGLAFIIALKLYEEQFLSHNKNNPAIMILLAVLIMLMTGIKGPMGAVLISALWGTLLLGWILRKLPFKAVIPVLLISAAFLLVYMTILGSKGQSNANGSSIINIGNIIDICYWKDSLVDALKSFGLPVKVRLLIVFAAFLACYLTVYTLPLCVGYIRELVLVISGRKDFRLHKVIVYASFATGFIAMFILRYSGHSQIYFGLMALFMAPMISFWLFEDMESSGYFKSAFGRVTSLTIKGIFAVTICITGVILGMFLINEVGECISYASSDKEPDKYMSISKSEYEAMEWINKNTPKDSLLATDRYYSVALDKYSYQDRWANRFFLYGTYSNRFCYIAGSGYNMKPYDWPDRMEMIKKNNTFYDVANERRGDDARELGIDYVVVSKRFTDIPSLENEDYELCYRNEDVDIYRVLPDSSV